jgi:hypothetical protein
MTPSVRAPAASHHGSQRWQNRPDDNGVTAGARHALSVADGVDDPTAIAV